MLEVSLTAFKTVLAMDENPNLEERKFDIKVPYGVARAKLQNIAKGADEADIDWLLVEVTGKKRSELQSLKALTKTEFDNAEAIAKRMSDGTPLQYALGYCEFYGIKIAVNKNVLIPRPETEELVEKAIATIKEKQTQCDVLDLCTGSGAIALVVAKKSGAKVTASDVSSDALKVAESNFKKFDADVKTVLSDLYADLSEKFDVIISNPPYIKTDDIARLDKEVKDFEPKIALDGGEDGLDFYRKIISGAKEHLNEKGVIYLEIGAEQGKEVSELFGEEYRVEVIKDVSGKDRIIKGVLL